MSEARIADDSIHHSNVGIVDDSSPHSHSSVGIVNNSTAHSRAVASLDVPAYSNRILFNIN